MSDIEVIHETVARTARRRRWQNAWTGFWLGLFIGAWLWLSSLALHKVLPLPDAAPSVTGIIALFLLPAGLLLGCLRRLTLAETARWIDSRERFQERLGTALELAVNNQAGDWRQLVLEDAARHARRFDPRLALPYRVHSTWRWSVLALLLAVGLGFVPEYRTQRNQEKRAETAIMRDTGRQLAELVRREQQERPPALESTRQVLDDIQNLAAQLSEATLTRADALHELAGLTDLVRERLRDPGQNPAVRRLDEAVGRLGERGGDSASGLERRIQSSQQPFGRQIGDGFSSEPMDPAARDPETATSDFDPTVDNTQALEDSPHELAGIDSDLAGQLQKGQGSAALDSLEDMLEQLANPDLSRKQLDQLLAQTQEAAAPGGEYGRMGEWLADAADQLRQGNRTEAGHSLANAAEQLRQQMDQLGDSPGLMAALEGLRTAQMSIGNSTSWGLARDEFAKFQANTLADRRIDTRAEDRQQTDRTDWTGLWDNHQLERGEFGSLGLGDRGETRVRDAFTPTRIRGEIGPGGPMPSVSLRGLGVLGEGDVAYRDAVVAAQTTAQSALSQERVPWVYRGVVRDYFAELEDR